MEDTEINDLIQEKDKDQSYLQLKPSEIEHDFSGKTSIPLSALVNHGIISGENNRVKKIIRQSISRLSSLGISTVMIDYLCSDNQADIKTGEDNLSAGSEQVVHFLPEKRFPTEVFTLEEGNGVNMRSGMADLGPLLFERMIVASDTEAAVIRQGFAYCSDNKIPAVGIRGFMEVLKHLRERDSNEESLAKPDTADFVRLMKKLEDAENAGAGKFLGEKVFDVQDFIYIDEAGRGVINIIEIEKLNKTPLLYTSFLLQLIIKLYLIFPDTGKLTKPKLVVYLPRAELLFRETESPVLKEIVMALEGLRHKGIGVFFGTKQLADMHEEIIAATMLKIWPANDPAVREVFKNYSFFDKDKVADNQDDLLIRQAGTEAPVRGSMVAADDIFTVERNTGIAAVEKKSRLAERYNEMRDERTAYQIVLSAIAEQAGKVVVPKEDFVKSAEPETTSNEPHGLNRLIKKILRIK